MNKHNLTSGHIFATTAVITAVVLSTLFAGTIANAQEEITPSSETSTSTPPTEESPPASSEVLPPSCCETATSTAPAEETQEENQPPTVEVSASPYQNNLTLVSWMFRNDPWPNLDGLTVEAFIDNQLMWSARYGAATPNPYSAAYAYDLTIGVQHIVKTVITDELGASTTDFYSFVIAPPPSSGGGGGGSLPNNPPTLSFPVSSPYAGDGIDPNFGSMNTQFTFRVIYTDADDDKPVYVNVHIEVESNNNGIIRTENVYATDFPDSLDYTVGQELLEGKFAGDFPAGTYKYYFEAFDGKSTVRLPVTGGFTLFIYSPTLSNLLQWDGSTVISEGYIIRHPFIAFSANVSEPDGNQVKLQMELRRFEESFTGFEEPFTGFDDGGILTSDPVPSGSENVRITIAGLSDGKYHWRARVIDSQGNTSPWQEFGSSGNVDFEIINNEIDAVTVAVKSQANIRSDRGTSAPIIGVAQRGDLLKLLPLCSKTGDTNCNDDTLLYTLKDGHYWLKVRWQDSTGFIAEDLVMTVVPKDQPERVKKLMAEVFAQPDFVKIQSFPIELLLAIATHESGGTLNNEITSVDSPFSGIMQVHPKTSGWNRNCIQSPKGDFQCQLEQNEYWTKIQFPFTDLFGISTDDKGGKVFMLKNYTSTAYQNTDEGLRNNISDGLKVLKDKYGARCPEESLFFIDSLTGIKYELTCGDMEKIRATWAYNGFGGGYLAMVSDSLHNLSSVFTGTSYPNTDQLIEKLHVANDHKIEVKKYSPVDLRVQDSSGAVVGEFNGEVKDEIYNAVYDPSTESIGIFFPGGTYRYIVAGNATGTYGLVINLANGATTTAFVATDIPIAPDAVHEYTVDEAALERGEEGVIIRIDENGDGTFEKTISSDGELTEREYILQTKTVIDFAPDTLNVKSVNGRATVYIELPDGFDVSAIDRATIQLNGIAVLEKPATIGDYDSDGIPDLMVKFDRSIIIGTLSQEENIATITVTGKVVNQGNRLSFRGEDIIKITGRK